LSCVTIHTSSPTAQEKRCSTGDTAHSTVESGDVSRHIAQRLDAGIIRIMVIVRSRIDENDGNSRPTKIRVDEFEPGMRREMSVDLVLQNVVIGERRHSHRDSTINE
jgi:hypothetical protein